MITKQILQNYDSKIEKYFDYILDRQVHKEERVKELIEAMSQRQRNHFAQWLDDTQGCKFHHSYIDQVKSILFNL